MTLEKLEHTVCSMVFLRTYIRPSAILLEVKNHNKEVFQLIEFRLLPIVGLQDQPTRFPVLLRILLNFFLAGARNRNNVPFNKRQANIRLKCGKKAFDIQRSANTKNLKNRVLECMGTPTFNQIDSLINIHCKSNLVFTTNVPYGIEHTYLVTQT